MKTVNEVSKLTGVSIRTLHYYDKIGLLIDEYAKRAKERWGNTPEYKELLRIEYI